MPIEPVTESPYQLFHQWFHEAEEREPKYPNAMTLATTTLDSGQPDVRVVLLKGIDERGPVFYTNYESAKGNQLLGIGRAALCFYWKSLDRQVRFRGKVEPVSPEEADAYFATRPRESQIGAWASNQSHEITGRAELLDRFREYEAQYQDTGVPRPPHWSGFRLLPDEIEFWQEGDFRLHDRLLYKRDGDRWRTVILAP